MAQILIPTRDYEDWKSLLARPDRHWKPGYSAMALAQRWEQHAARGFPPEIADLLVTASRRDWKGLRPLIAVPEYKVPLPGGSRASQTDLFVLARAERELVAIAVEGKVRESFGPTVGQRRRAGNGSITRLEYLEKELGFASPCPDTIRYQLLHRTYAALHLAREFTATSAVMIVHSFDSRSRGLDDLKAFLACLGKEMQQNRLADLGEREGVRLYVGWAATSPGKTA